MEENKIIQINAGDKSVIELREGKALPLQEPQKIIISGNIDTVSKYIGQRGFVSDNSEVPTAIDLRKAIIIVERDKMSIVLLENPKDFYSNTISASLQLSTEFKKFGINENQTYTPAELGDFIKLNRAYFTKKEDANKLVSLLKNFTAKVNKQIEDSEDGRGNKDHVRRQVVESNLPPSFNLNLPIFKGQKKVEFEVEICIEPKNLECYLFSADANDVIIETRDTIIDEEISKFAGFCVLER